MPSCMRCGDYASGGARGHLCNYCYCEERDALYERRISQVRWDEPLYEVEETEEKL